MDSLIFELQIVFYFQLFLSVEGQTIKFHGFPGLENEIPKFHDFPGFLWPMRTLWPLERGEKKARGGDYH